MINTSIATVSLSGTLEQKLTAIAAAGFDGFEIFEPDFIGSALTPAALAARAADLGLTIDLYQPFRDLDSTDEAQYARNLVRAEHKFDLMEQLGCDTILVCSSPLPSAVRDDDRLAAQLHGLAERAHRRGIRVAYEALAWGAHVNTYRHAWNIVAAVDHPALGTCLDSFHILSRGDDPEGIRDIPGEKIFFLQLADAPAMAMDVLQWSRHYRKFPGQGTFDLAAFGAHVHATGYAGPWSLEIFNDVFRQSSTGRTAADAHRSLRHLQEQVAARMPDSAGLFVPPARPDIDGVVSLRIAAGPDRATQLRTMLGSIGFGYAGRHREHELELWRHGELTVAVDATSDTAWTAPAAGTPLPVLSQIGIRSADPDAWEARALALEVPAHEVELPGAVSEFGDPAADVVRLRVTEATSIDLRGPASRAAWREAFEPQPQPLALPSLLTGVDHVALAVRPDDWDGIMLRLRSVFGMQPNEGVDIPDSVGQLRSQSLTMTGTGSASPLRISLNMVPGCPAGPEHPTAIRRGGVSHVAFTCADIFATAAELVTLGHRRPAISANYYDDLATRFDLDPQILWQMREFGILYDADGGGEYFQLFTETVGADLFFEIVQRVGDYRGQGELNSAVRVAAHLRAGC
ncbi:TIM barrel protein [Nocardia sp. CA2R105]|uniref:sugar phosphate isomerase/epimerase and 4-hydroxyphenylpyruvate domain-containing protein n=1 Tax=Nocardia coffeae TaxID=2873381 RepID=UPI001CA635B6|nr:sugar phosphate isomerase/epimerase and 4-hydroxyphenylpyruvate domain-containing protein [Nocardia coffeae]MBY8861038.1 TIM barrel protein [Nocardia coffeae]